MSNNDYGSISKSTDPKSGKPSLMLHQNRQVLKRFLLAPIPNLTVMLISKCGTQKSSMDVAYSS